MNRALLPFPGVQLMPGALPFEQGGGLNDPTDRWVPQTATSALTARSSDSWRDENKPGYTSRHYGSSLSLAAKGATYFNDPSMTNVQTHNTAAKRRTAKQKRRIEHPTTKTKAPNTR